MKTHSPHYRSQAGQTAVMALYEADVQQSPVPLESRTVNTSAGPSHILIAGPENAPPFLLFHGWNSNAANLTTEFPFLFNDYRVYMPDIIGHTGKSAPTRLATKGPAYADWALEVLDALGLERVRCMGISGGGWMTLKLAARASQRLVRAAALSTDGLAPANMVGIFSGMVPAALWPNQATLARFIRFLTSPDAPPHPGKERFGEGMRVILSHYKSQFNPGLLPLEELEAITAPLLILMGEHERAFNSLASIQRAQRLIPGLVAAEIVPQAGHLMTLDQPEWLKNRLLPFFAQGV